jgi:molecular chaperone GrpE
MTSWFRRRSRDGGYRGENGDTGTDSPDRASDTDVTPLQLDPVPRLLPGDEVADDETAGEERQALLQLCLYALDRARSAGVAERLEEGLAKVGVTALRPDGCLFDPSWHEAGGTVCTDDPGLEGVIAETEVPGFADRGTLLRAPIVTVYTVRST